MVMIHQRHRRTDGQTDRQTDDMQSQYRALHYSASRGKKNPLISAFSNRTGTDEKIGRFSCHTTDFIVRIMVRMTLVLIAY